MSELVDGISNVTALTPQRYWFDHYMSMVDAQEMSLEDAMTACRLQVAHSLAPLAVNAA